MANEFVRVKVPTTGHEETVTKAFAEGYNLPIINEPAVDSSGRPLPGKPNVEPEKADATKATTKATDTGKAGN